MRREKESLVPLGARVPLGLKDRLDTHVNNCKDSSLQDVVSEALTWYLDEIQPLNEIGQLTPRDRVIVEAFAGALSRRDRFANIAFKLMEAAYDVWREEERVNQEVAGNRQGNRKDG